MTVRRRSAGQDVRVGLEPDASSVEQVAARLVPGGRVLATTNLFGSPGHPIIRLDEAAHARRLLAHQEPMCRFDDVAATMCEAPSMMPPSTVSLLAFVSTARPSRAVRLLRGVRVFCRTILVVADQCVPGEPGLSEFDFHGITVASVDERDEVRVHVLGDPGRLPGSAVSSAWARHREEQLYAAVLQQA